MAYFAPPARYCVLVVADSRALDIHNWLQDWGDIELDVVPAPSTGIEGAVEVLITQRRDAKPELVLILNGICDVLEKNRTAHRYFELHETVEEVVAHYVKQIKRGQELLEIFFDESNWMFNALTGADIADYNNHHRKHMTDEELARHHQEKTPDPLQPVMDQAVLDINSEIVKINKNNNVFTPYTATHVHRHYGHSYHHSYQYARDGCHLKPEGKSYWAREIKKAIMKTRMKSPKVVD